MKISFPWELKIKCPLGDEDLKRKIRNIVCALFLVTEV